MKIIYRYLLCIRAIKLVVISIGLFLFLQLVFSIKDMNNLTIDYPYFKIKNFIFLFSCFFICLYFTKRLYTYSYDFSLIVESFMRSIQGHVL